MINKMDNHDFTIIIVDDDPAHSTLIKRNLLKCSLTNEILLLSSGQQLLDYVFSKGQYKNREPLQKPLILLDINMPGIDGIEVLRTLKTTDLTQKIPIFMLTTTDDPSEVDTCFRLGCNGYLIKPVEHKEFAEKIQALGSFLKLNQFPQFIQCQNQPTYSI